MKKNHYIKTTSSQKEILIRLTQSEGKTIREAAKMAGINENTARSIICGYRRNGTLLNLPRGGNNKIKITSHSLEKIEQLVESNPQATLKQIKHDLEISNIFLSISSISTALAKLCITVKKCHTEIDRVNTPLTIANRRNYALNFVNCAPTDMRKCIYIDESGFNLHLHRAQARSKKGTRAKIILPTIRGRNVTLIAAMSSSGILHTKIIDGSTCNGQKFNTFIEDLVSLLHENADMNGAWFIMDNAKIHKTGELKDIISASSYELHFLSPYSYQLNPIEKVFSKIKASVRRLLTDRTGEHSLSELIKQGIETVTPEDCSNYVMHTTRNLSIAISGKPM